MAHGWNHRASCVTWSRQCDGRRESWKNDNYSREVLFKASYDLWWTHPTPRSHHPDPRSGGFGGSFTLRRLSACPVGTVGWCGDPSPETDSPCGTFRKGRGAGHGPPRGVTASGRPGATGGTSAPRVCPTGQPPIRRPQCPNPVFPLTRGVEGRGRHTTSTFESGDD